MIMRIVRCSGAWLVLALAVLCWSGSAAWASLPCATFPSGYVPFSQIYATYPVNAGSLIVGAITPASYSQLSSVPLPSYMGQTFCVPIQLAPGYWVTAYVPTAAERIGYFSYYLGVWPYTQLFDPLNGVPYTNNFISPTSGVSAWHIAAPALSPAGSTQSLISRVNALYSLGVLNSGQDNSLTKELQKALDMTNAGKINGAVGNLQSFITEVQDLESSGVLTSAQANVLIYGANIVIAELSEL